MSKLLYLAGPYSHESQRIRHWRAEQHAKAAASLAHHGWSVFSPIAQSQFICNQVPGLEADSQHWMEQDLPILEAMAAKGATLGVLKLDGWRMSTGTERETDVASDLGMTIRYFEPDQMGLRATPFIPSFVSSKTDPPDMVWYPISSKTDPPDTKTFATGSRRSTEADGTRYDLVSPIGLRRLAGTYREGAEKYGDYNWVKGQPAGELLNHAMKHIDQWRGGDRSEDHLAHAAWNLFTLMHFEETRPDMMDVPSDWCDPPKDRS